ncbi:MAG TPA: HAMP domain-containing sensor histidine kinase, partial [Polyangiaceae bacterium]|nr:HAMP domain-containing sensor histidine kinase [Polyangiaceae bacterium]
MTTIRNSSIASTSTEGATTRLADLLELHRDRVLERWAQRVLDDPSLPSGRSLRAAQQPLLEALLELLRKGPGAVTQVLGAAGSGESSLWDAAQNHTRERLLQGCAAPAIRRELSLLRSVVLEIGEDSKLVLQGAEAALLHEGLDQALFASSEALADGLRIEIAFYEHFLDVMGHDLRNPISAIKLGSSMLTRETQPPAARKRTAQRITSSANRMLRMLEDLLDFSHLHRGEPLTLERKPCDLEQLCRAVVDELGAARPQQNFILECAGTVLGVWDEARIAQALTNLLSGAADHAPPDAEIRIRVWNDGAAQVQVYGAQIKISADEIGTLFDPLRRLGAAKAGE